MHRVNWLMVCALLAGLFAVTIPRAYACSCVQTDYAAPQYLEKMDAVFVGRVIEIHANANPSADGLPDDKIVTLFVSKGFKGIEEAVLEVASNLSSASCGIDFEVGREYLIFAARRNGQLTTHLCLGTQPLETAAPLLPRLNNAVRVSPAPNTFLPVSIAVKRNAVWNCRANYACRLAFRAACANLRAAPGIVVFCR